MMQGMTLHTCGAPVCLQSRGAGRFLGARLEATPVYRASRPQAVQAEARFKGVNTDLSAVPAWKQHEKDNGSAEVQIATISARIAQLTPHLQQHRKDFSTTRGLYQLLGRRKRLLLYLYNTKRETYQALITGLGIRPLKIRAGRNLAVQMPTPTAAQTEQFQKTGKVPQAMKKSEPVRAVAPAAPQ